MQRRFLFLALLGTLCGALTAPAQAQHFTFNFTGAEPSGSARLRRDGIAGAPKAFPGTLGSVSTFFHSAPILVPGGATLTIDDTAQPFGTYFVALYSSGGVNVADLTQNYIGDVGNSGGPTALVDFLNVGPAATFNVVWMNTPPEDSTSVQAIQVDTTVRVSSGAPEPASLGLLALGGLALAVRRRRK